MTAESHCSPTGISLEDTGYGYTLSVINGKYKMIILYWLALYKPVLRFNELQRCIGTISYKTLSSTLKELEKDRLVVRKEYPQIPPKVEYSLSERGRSLIPVIDMMCNWGAAPAGTAGAVRNDLGQASSALRGAALQLNVQNLADKKYVSSCSGEYACIYGSGRSIIASVNYRW